jgi:hypothetical protein
MDPWVGRRFRYTKIRQGGTGCHNAKDWDRARAAITTDFVYEEMGTGRKLTGAEATLEAWRTPGQAKAQRHYFDMVTLLRQLGVTK